MVFGTAIHPGLDPTVPFLHNGDMELQGRVSNGVVELEGDSVLPEGATVTIIYPAAPGVAAGTKRRIRVPLVRCQYLLPAPLTNERIGEILDEEDAAPRR